MKAKELAIETPCPVDLDRSLSDGRTRAWDCGHCSKTVHVLSSMTERDARSFLRAHEGQTLCITYLEGADGAVRFQPDPPVVPVASLTRRRTAVAAVGLVAALAACTPTDPAPAIASPIPPAIESVGKTSEPEPTTSLAKLVDKARVDATQHKTEKADVVEAKIETPVENMPRPIVDPSSIPRPGGMMIPSLAPPTEVAEIEDEPCDSEASTETTVVTKRPPMRRGGRSITALK